MLRSGFFTNSGKIAPSLLIIFCVPLRAARPRYSRSDIRSCLPDERTYQEPFVASRQVTGEAKRRTFRKLESYLTNKFSPYRIQILSFRNSAYGHAIKADNRGV